MNGIKHQTKTRLFLSPVMNQLLLESAYSIFSRIFFIRKYFKIEQRPQKKLRFIVEENRTKVTFDLARSEQKSFILISKTGQNPQ